MTAPKKPRRYDYVQAALLSVHRGTKDPSWAKLNAIPDMRRLLRRLVREAVKEALQGYGWASEARGSADRIAKELLP